MPDGPDTKRPSPKWLEGDHHENFRLSKKHEQRLAKRLGGRRLPGSGGKINSGGSLMPMKTSLKGYVESETPKGDIKTPELLIEHKFTRAEQIALKREWLNKVAEGARMARKVPAVLITFERGLTNKPEDWLVLPIEVAEELLKARLKP